MVSPDAYIATALHLCQQINLNGDSENIVMDSSFFRGLTRSSHPNYELIFPIIFNLKHGIELYLKGLGCIDHHSYRTIHDFHELFDFIIGEASVKNAAHLKKMKDETWGTIKKYYYGTYIPSNTIESKPDTMNDAERYPEGTAYPIPDPFVWVSSGVLKEIETDIKYLEEKFAQCKKDILQ